MDGAQIAGRLGSTFRPFYDGLKGIGDWFYSKTKHSSLIWGPPQYEIGVQIGDSDCVIVEIDNSEKIPKLVHLAVHEVRSDGPVDGSKLLSDAFTQQNFGSRYVRTALSGKSIIVRFIKFPKMSRKEVRTAIEFEAEKYIPYEVSEVYIDFDVLHCDEGQKYQDLVLVAAKCDFVDEVRAKFDHAELELEMIDLEIFACYNAFAASPEAENDEIQALVNVGRKVTSILIVEKGMPAFTRDIFFGSDDIIQGLIKKTGSERKDIVNARCEGGAGWNNKHMDAIEEVLGFLNKELSLSFDYFLNQTKTLDAKISKIHLFGDAVDSRYMTPVMKKHFSNEVNVFDPLSIVAVGDNVDKEVLRQNATRLTVPIGLAIR